MAIVPVTSALDGYAHEIQRKLWLAGFQVDCDVDPGTTLNKKIRQNQLAQYNFIGGEFDDNFYTNEYSLDNDINIFS